MSRPSHPTIHAKGIGPRLDGVIDLVAFAARPCPLSTSLDELPRRVAMILGADVCSIYLLEGDDLVMRGNVGFPANALGEVRLAVGEGITGRAVEYMRPMSVAAAPSDANFREFPVLNETRFPIFLAVPVAGPNGPLGALVVQRERGPGFDTAEIELAAALTAPIAAATERARLVETLRGEKKAPGGPARRVTLPGRTVVNGRAVGAVCALRRPSSRGEKEEARTKSELRKALDTATIQALKSLDAYAQRARALSLDVTPFESARTILDDGRLRDRAVEIAVQGQGLTHALTLVGGEAARTAARVGDAFGVDRAREIADICEALAMLAANDRRAEVPRGAVLVGDQVTLFDLLVSARTNPAAVILSGKADGPLSRTLLALIGAPAVVDVPGLFNWVSDGEIALVDGDHGLVRINPGRAEVASVRVEKKRETES